ncbi:MAG: ABC transporter ATP-binding protein [Candidatus Rokubacteria bacterium]|nr:ABC transporter ATP-binding protein [Candidatus Rokubacteria bacterium]
MILEALDLVAGYGKKEVLHGVSLRVEAGEIVGLIGHNGAGKTTLLRVLFGLLPVQRGEVRYAGRPITGRRPALNVKDGLSFVPQGHGIFTDLTVRENLELGGHSLGEADPDRVAAIYNLFPILMGRRDQRAGTLSGGQQQMLALGLALMLRPKLLLLDEPSLGLAPILVQRVLESVVEINRRFGTAVLLVEQNVKQALRIAGRVYVMKVGQISLEDQAASLLERSDLWQLF